MTGLVIGVSGKLRSGKTHFSSEVSRQLGWPRVSFGEYVRTAVELEGGDPSCRNALQDYGQRRVETDVLGFCRSVIGQVEYNCDTNLIVDGIRHLSVFEAIQEICEPMQLRLVYVECPDPIRYTRARNLKVDEHEFKTQNLHKVEFESGNILKRVASLVVNCEDDESEVVRCAIENILQWSCEVD